MKHQSTHLRRALSFSIIALTLAGCAKEVKRKESVADSTTSAPVVTTIEVTRGTQGMSERITWAFSPDKKSVLVVASPVGVEAEPLPSAFFFGDEASGFQVQMDTVWDVAIAPDWKSIAFTKAYTIADGAGVIDPSRLVELARHTSIDTAALRSGAFPSSGMSDARAIAQPGIIRVPSNPRSSTAGDSAAPKMFPIARGWQIRWTSDGALIGLGNPSLGTVPPVQTVSWASLDPKTGELHGSLPATSKIVEPKMFAGPVLHADGGPDMTSAPAIKVERSGRSGTITTARGFITLTVANDSAGEATVGSQALVGPGIALAATVGGQFIVALAPRTKIGKGEMPVEVVVYRVSW